MNTQTRRPSRKSGNAARNSKRYYKQTAHVEARRDGKPLIFGWGKHLSHTEKVRIQRRAAWGAAVLIFLILVGILVGTWINLNIIVPGLAFTTVNGHGIPQSEYREMVAVKTQLELNKLYGPNGLTNQLTSLQKQDAQVNASISQSNTQISNLNSQIKKLPAGSSQRAALTKQLNDAQKQLADETSKHQSLQNQINNLNNNTIPLEKEGFTQSQLGNDSATWLQDDEVLREWLATQSPALQARINPTDSQVNRDFNSLKKNMPTSNGYNTFMSQMGITDDQVRAMLTIIDRRTNAQSYFASLLKSPSYQVLARQIVLQTQQKANQVLQDLQKGQDFGKLAKQFSQDTATASKGGDLGYLTRYQYIDTAGNLNDPSAIEDWIFDPARKLNELSPIMFANGSYFIVQIMNIDPARPVDAKLLKALQANALVDWLQDQRALPGQHITTANQNMLFDQNNLPPNGILPSSAPTLPTPTPGA